MNFITKFISAQKPENIYRSYRIFLGQKLVFHFNSQQYNPYQNRPQNNNKYLITNYFSAFLPKDYPELLRQYQYVTYNQFMELIIRVQEKEKMGHMNSSDLTSSQLTFLFSRILFYRQDYDNAISLLFILNHTISEQYLNPQSPNYDQFQQTDHNLNLTNSLLEISHLYGFMGNQSNQKEYVDLAEDQLIDFLGTDQQRFEISLKFLQIYKDLKEFDKVKEYEDKLLSFLDRIDYPHSMYPIFKNLLKYFQETHQKQAIYQLGLKMIEKYYIYSDLKEELEGEIIPLLQEEIIQNTAEGKVLRQSIKNLKLQQRDSLTSRRQLQELISQISKLKFESKYDEAIQLSHNLLEKTMNDLPNNIPSDLLLITFNNLFVLYALKNEFAKASEFGEKWVKLSEKLKIPSQIIQSRSNIATYYLKVNRLDNAQQHLDITMQILDQNPTSIDLIDKFIVQCLHFQIAYLNQKISYQNVRINLNNVFQTLDKINASNISSDLLFSKVIEMYTFLRNSQLKYVLKPFGLSYMQIKSRIKDLSATRMDYIIAQDIGEIEFIEKNYEESLKCINQAIRIYESLKKNANQIGNQLDKPIKPRWIILKYIKACIEVKRGDIDKGFQILNQYPVQSEQEETANRQSEEKTIIQNNFQNYWGSRLQAETFLKLGQYNMAYTFTLKALKYSQIIQDIDLHKNTYELKQQIKQCIPDQSQILEEEDLFSLNKLNENQNLIGQQV